MNRHSPLPFRFEDDAIRAPIRTSDGDAIATPFWNEALSPATKRANGQFIVHACNNFYEMWVALKKAEGFIAGFEGDAAQEGIDVLLRDIRAVLAAAESEGRK